MINKLNVVRRYILSALIICWIVFVLISPTFSQTDSPESIWRRVLDANSPWLRPNPIQLTYEIHTELADVGRPKDVQVTYDGASGGARIRETVETLERETLYTDGLKADPSTGLYEFNRDVPTGYGVGATVQPAILQAAQQGTVPSSLQVVGRQTVDGRSVIVLEASDWNGTSSAGVDLPGSLSGPGQYECNGVRWTVDADNFTLVREETLHSIDGGGQDIAWDFSGGYYQTEDGYAPKSIVWSVSDRDYSARTEFNFQTLDGGAWFLENAKSYRNGELRYSGEVKNVSTGPVDKSLFDLAAAGITISDVTQGTAVVEGRVLLRGSGKPVEGARVRLLSSYKKTREPVWGEAVTKKDGFFRFTDLPALTYCVAAEKEGLTGATKKERFLYGFMQEFASIDVVHQSLETAAPAEGETVSIELELDEPVALPVRVVDADTGEAIPQATVGVKKTNVRGDGRNVELAIADSDGRHTFNDIPKSKIVVAAQKEGFFGFPWQGDTLYYREGDYGAKKLNMKCFDLGKSEAPGEITLKLQSAGSIVGVVQNERGEPIDDAELRLGSKTHSKEDGSFEFTGLARSQSEFRIPGYTLYAFATGYAPYEQFNIDVPTGEPVHVDVVLKEGGRITGVVKNPEGKPVSGVGVYASFQPDADKLQSGQQPMRAGGMGMSGKNDPSKDVTDAEGTYRLHSLYEGTYWIKAATDGYEAYVGADVRVELAKETKHDIQLTPIDAISGIVLSSTGVPIKGAQIYLQEESNPKLEAAQGDPFALFKLNMSRQSSQVKSDENGRFEIVRLHDAVFKLNAVLNQSGKEVLYQFVSGVRPGQTDIEVRFDPARERPDLKGKVVDAATGKPIERFHLVYQRGIDDGQQFYGDRYTDLAFNGRDVVNASGEFYIENLPFNPQTILVRALGYASRLIGPVDPDRPLNETFVPMMKEAQIHARLPETVRFEERARLIVTPRPNALPEKEQLAMSDPLRSFGMDTTVNRNRIVLRNVPAGSYDLLAVADNALASATCIQVTPGETTEVETFQIESFERPNERVEHRFLIQKEDGSPWALTPVEINITTPFGSKPSRQTTDAKGRFVLMQPPLPQSWRKAVVQVGASPGTLYEASIQPGENTIVHKKPEGGASVKGAVLREGEPAAKVTATLISCDERENRIVFRQETNGMGRYVMNGVPAGRYRLMLTVQDAINSEDEFRLYDVELAEGENRFIRSELTGPSLSGIAVNPNNEPISGANVQLSFAWEPDALALGVGARAPLRTTMADAHGVFTFKNLQAGKYTIWTSRYSYGISQKQTAAVEARDVDGIRLVLE